MERVTIRIKGALMKVAEGMQLPEEGYCVFIGLATQGSCIKLFWQGVEICPIVAFAVYYQLGSIQSTEAFVVF